LYYDRKVFDATTQTRGLCSIFNSCAVPSGIDDQSIFCTQTIAPFVPTDSIYPQPGDGTGNYDFDGCNPANCDDCEINFTTNMGTGTGIVPGDGRSYTIKAVVTRNMNTNPKTTNLSVDSLGTYQNVARAIHLSAPELIPSCPCTSTALPYCDTHDNICTTGALGVGCGVGADCASGLTCDTGTYTCQTPP